MLLPSANKEAAPEGVPAVKRVLLLFFLFHMFFPSCSSEHISQVPERYRAIRYHTKALVPRELVLGF